MPALLFLLLLLLLQMAQSTTSDASRDLGVLLDLRASLSVTANSPGFESWTPTTPPCNFSFVTCDSDLQIVSISLTATAVAGTLPFRSICRLPRLSVLSAASNYIRGPLASDLANCTSLTYLDLSRNALTGPVPDLSPLRDLRVLNLSRNLFTGPLPDLGNLTGLAALSLSDVAFDPTPFPLWVLGLHSLNHLHLSNCTLTGRIPAGIGNLTALSDLELSYNSLTGVIPPELGRLRNLCQLELYRNSLIGNLPAGFGNLTNLQYLDASSNQLQGDLTEIRTLRNLTLLHLYNNHFSGSVPVELGELPSLTDLSLYSNNLSGELPRGLGSSSEFRLIDVSTNAFTGSIPPDMCRRGRLQKLLMLENRFTGVIPAGYGACVSLLRFRVADNDLSGVVPEGIWGLPSVNIIDLTRNRFTGTISASIGSATALGELLVSSNRFSGSIPEDIGGAVGLVAIDASSNLLSGPVPTAIGKLVALNQLRLQGNLLTGAIPSSIGSCRSLNELDLSGNRLNGGIPAVLGVLPVLNTLNLSGNSLTGSIPSALSSLKLVSLDLSDNHLSGDVPPAFASAAFRSSFRGNRGLCGSEILHLQPCPTGRLRSRDRIRVIVAAVIAGAAVLLACLGCLLFVLRQRRRRPAAVTWDVKPFGVLAFDEREIVKGVVEENLVGRGGSGSVYRVQLQDGSSVAVKQIRNVSGKQLEAEVGTLSAVRHVGVVKLYCSISVEGGASLLVYEYLSNGSLWERLHEGRGEGLPWVQRHEVAVGAARGLEYLHHGCGRTILHRDVKSSNILLDDDMKPRIADFGLAKILPKGKEEEAEDSAVVAGTHGYIAPEYAYKRRVDEKSDVYSFGVVLMELVTGRRPIESHFGDSKDIVHWIYSKMTSREEVLSLLDPEIPGEFEEEAVRVLKVGILCTARSPSLRPSMKVVVQMLEDAARWQWQPQGKPRIRTDRLEMV